MQGAENVFAVMNKHTTVKHGNDIICAVHSKHQRVDIQPGVICYSVFKCTARRHYQALVKTWQTEMTCSYDL